MQRMRLLTQFVDMFRPCLTMWGQLASTSAFGSQSLMLSAFSSQTLKLSAIKAIKVYYSVALAREVLMLSAFSSQSPRLSAFSSQSLKLPAIKAIKIRYYTKMLQINGRNHSQKSDAVYV